MAERQSSILIDHGDMRPIAAGADESVADRNDIVQLNPDHPGFRDPEYRRRRNQIAQIAMKRSAASGSNLLPDWSNRACFWKTWPTESFSAPNTFVTTPRLYIRPNPTWCMKSSATA